MSTTKWLKRVLVPFWTVEAVCLLALIGVNIYSLTTFVPASELDPTQYPFALRPGGYGIFVLWLYQRGDPWINNPTSDVQYYPAYGEFERAKIPKLLAINIVFLIVEIILAVLFSTTIILMARKKLSPRTHLVLACIRSALCLVLFVWVFFGFAWYIGGIFAITMMICLFAQLIYISVIVGRSREKT
ncbi:Hypothetical protein R9X50_00423300 [Acrodontium crateriforme]|uniref:Uncharacterized protein n=1 Tax=Acrodontium crateriforme TaxID=150365 RepID=A0AAQ3M768_9PEZI|nr:Hypothetical protein R9X50_00423300 [Acrodontium crateriforme]